MQTSLKHSNALYWETVILENPDFHPNSKENNLLFNYLNIVEMLDRSTMKHLLIAKYKNRPIKVVLTT